MLFYNSLPLCPLYAVILQALIELVHFINHDSFKYKMSKALQLNPCCFDETRFLRLKTSLMSWFICLSKCEETNSFSFLHTNKQSCVHFTPIGIQINTAVLHSGSVFIKLAQIIKNDGETKGRGKYE